MLEKSREVGEAYIAGKPVTLIISESPRSLLDGMKWCTQELFSQFLRIQEQFPDEIGMNRVKFAKSMAAGVIKRSVRGTPLFRFRQQLLNMLGREADQAILLEETILEDWGSEGRVDATKSAPREAKTERCRERGPDARKHQERVEFEDALIQELGTVRDRQNSATTLDELRKMFPTFKLWDILSPTEQGELLLEEFKPRAWARRLTSRKFGVGEEAIKKSRQVLKRDTPSD